jgi:hypothetical protein
LPDHFGYEHAANERVGFHRSVPGVKNTSPAACTYYHVFFFYEHPGYGKSEENAGINGLYHEAVRQIKNESYRRISLKRELYPKK